MAQDKTQAILAAAQRLGFTTLETRNSDSLDFRDIHVATLADVLAQVYEAGRKAEQSQDTVSSEE